MIYPIKHKKWDSEWQSQIKILGKNLDQAKNKQLESLLEEGNALQTEKDKLSKEIRALKAEQKSLSQVFSNHREAKKEVDRLNDATNQTTHNPRQANFLGTGNTKWQTDGWTKKAADHFTPDSGKLDNLYQVKISGSNYETTEEQVIQTIARVVKAFQKVDAEDFEAKYNTTETDTAKQAQVQSYLKEIQEQAAEVIVGSSKDKKPSYDFSYNFHKGKFADDGTWQPEATDYSQPPFDYQHFFEFIALVHNQPFLTALDKDKQKGIDKNENWQIFLKGDKWETDQLKDYGITIDPTKTELWKTSEVEKRTITSSKTGIAGWLDLAHSISQNTNNQSKLTAAFTNSPTQQLLTNLNGWTQVNGFLTDGASFTLPESLESMETILDELETDKLASANKKAALIEKIDQKNNEIKEKETDLKAKDTEMDVLIKEIITKQRGELKKYEIEKGFKEENRRTFHDLIVIQHLLNNIRYLENNGDSTSPSSESSENTVYEQVNDLQNELTKLEWNHLVYIRSFEDLGFKGVNEKTDIDQAIERVKAGKYTKDGKEIEVYFTLKQVHESYEAKEKLVKLHELETKAKEAIKKAMGKSDEPEKLPEWQSKLKTLDPLITETVFTKEKMEDFQKHTNFKNIHGVESLFKKVLDKDAADATKFKVKADFIEKLKKEDSEVDDLAKMITKLSAEKVIKLIHFFEYEKTDKQETQKEKRRKFSWDRKKKVSDKFIGESEDYSLPETEKEDFTKFLYELATGQKSLASISKPTGQNPNPTEETGFAAHLKRNWGKYTFAGILLAIGIGATIYFWDKIKTLWETKEEENE